ncbi:hypothetical protein R3P38DRAFT_3202667 [Favolaschia claudopus]|uniref:Uncharacterized protein n=1 Tax=Favolaschia claudopus TaxID=2862362 RepID=A0AAW0ATS6_9AGAR
MDEEGGETMSVHKFHDLLPIFYFREPPKLRRNLLTGPRRLFKKEGIPLVTLESLCERPRSLFDRSDLNNNRYQVSLGLHTWARCRDLSGPKATRVALHKPAILVFSLHVDGRRRRLGWKRGEVVVDDKGGGGNGSSDCHVDDGVRVVGDKAAFGLTNPRSTQNVDSSGVRASLRTQAYESRLLRTRTSVRVKVAPLSIARMSQARSAPEPAPDPPAVAPPAPFAPHSVRTKVHIRLDSLQTVVVSVETVYYSRLQRLAHDN